MGSGTTRSATSAPTLEDVAERARVSTATVSRCLNSPGQVTAATRERVMQAVRELGYAPNFGARVLAAKRTDTFGAIIPTMENAIFARALQAFQEELGKHGITLLVASSSYRLDIEEDQIRALTARGAEGLLLIGHHRSPDIYSFLQQHGIPTLIAWVYDPQEPQVSVGFDNRRAMEMLASEVIALGHRRIAVISAEQSANDRASARVEGIRLAMRKAGLDPDSYDLIETPYGIDFGAEAFVRLMDREQRPTVVMCGNDVLAAGAIRQARAMGIRVPEDVSVTGFDDIELASVIVPALTTVHVPHREMGREAARMLVSMVRGEGQPASRELATELRWRDTLAAPSQTQPKPDTAVSKQHGFK
ncbi:LacI family DNA-binding transcriptional regulator [Defluviimonas sp. D31]|uniref:LacI family DNA-binding transcriptional regulator n=1 Tax=Defluviimonas sp. D31 TaxID=3083253 RepID=UPI00296F12C8|nr:LacI family DNA-binding transcriptional regulator [Defluviimonas sp. D31]MDW4550542.1 LacI family DNA-binding transcriptional regulator [Defluviimonas sp. D31]